MREKASFKKQLFKNVTLAKKLGIGFSLILVLLAIVSLISFYTINTASGNFSMYRELARDTNLMGRVQANMLMVRMNVKDFIITSSKKSLEQYNDYVKKTNGFIKEAKQEIQNPERAALIQTAENALLEYETAFKGVENASKHRDNLIENTLNIQGAFMENTLSSILETAEKDRDTTAAYYSALALKHLLLARLYIVKFLDVNDRKHVDRVIEEFGKLQKNLEILDRELQNPKRRKWLNDVIKAKEIYEKSSDELAQVIFNRNRIITETLYRLGPEIAKTVGDTKLSVKRDQDILGPKVQRENDQGILIIAILAIIAFVFGIGNAWFIVRTVLRLLGKDPQEIADIARKLGMGDLTMTFDEENIRGVYGDFRNTVANLIELVGEIRGNSDNVAASSEELNEIASQISAASDSTVEKSNSVASAAEEMKSNMNSVASAMEQATGSVDTVAAAAEEMNTSIAGIARDVEVAMKSTDSAVVRASEVSDNVKTLGKNASDISVVTETIAEISEKTNLLALNATIEAARAGDAGKGFAVVANEIKDLANQTADATADISKKLQEIQSSTSAAVSDVEEITEVIRSINESVTTVQETMTQQSDATQEITENIAQTSLGLKEINQNVYQSSEAAGQVASDISGVNESANEMSNSNAQLNQSAEELSVMASQLKEKMNQFKV